MIAYIKGKITQLRPTNLILETGGIGYDINISLTTYTTLSQQEEGKLFIYEVLREDTHQLYGFMTELEKEVFLLLISVSGIGANTARVIMSSYSTAEIRQIIATEDVPSLNAIKGIGTKTAQRIIVDLKDKILKVGDTADIELMPKDHQTHSTIKEETLAALSMLGYRPNVAQKVIDKILNTSSGLSVEQVIKQALKML